jgi:hypothetical protein
MIMATVCGVFLFAVLVMPVGGVELGKPTANLSEKFATPADWAVVADSGVTAGWSSNENVSVQYALRGPSSYLTEAAELKAGVMASGGIFSGDLSAMEAFSFDVKPKAIVTAPSLYFVSGTGAKWFLLLDSVPGLTSGVWSHVTRPIAFDSDAAKCWSAPSGRTQGDFYTDIKNVVEVGFSTVRDGNNNFAQAVEFDNVRLVGPWGTNLVDGVAYAWALEYGLTNDFATVGRDDVDKDGFTNFAEFLAGTDPNNSNDFFRVDIGRDEQGKVVVKWKDNKYMKFSLLQSSNLVTFAPVQGVSDVPGVGSQKVVEVSSPGVTGVRFYKVEISQ